MNIKDTRWYVNKAIEGVEMFALCFASIAVFMLLAIIS